MNYHPLKLIYLTNNPIVASIASEAGVEFIMVDLECIGKNERQRHVDSVKSKHSFSDIAPVKRVLRQSELIVRINPLYEGTPQEINQAVAGGADYLMLPMFRTAQEVDAFIRLVNGRAKIYLLLETQTACENLDDILVIPGIDRIHIGLNDLHLDMGLTFMFEPVANGYVEDKLKKIALAKIPYGVGGIARPGIGTVPAEILIAEHMRLGSSAAILSRSFYKVDSQKQLDRGCVQEVFKTGLSEIRDTEKRYSSMDDAFFSQNKEELKKRVAIAVAEEQRKKKSV